MTLQYTMDRVRTNPYGWFNDKELNTQINAFVKQGLLNRRSHTQVEWTIKGVESLSKV